MQRLVARYGNFIEYELDGASRDLMEWEGACGAGRRSIYIASNGRVGICPMSVESGLPGYGSVSKDTGMVDVVNSDFAKHVATLPSPNPIDCEGCPHELEHRGCLLHGLKQYMKTPDNCKWGQIHDVQELLESGQHSLTKNADGSYELPGELEHCQSGCGRASGSPLVQIASPEVRS